MIGCVLVPRLSLVAALGGRQGMVGRPVALAPEPGGPQVIGEASSAAEALGLRPGMRLAEALARCPSLVLAPPDPVRAEGMWERSLRRLEAIGAAVEAARAGEAFFSLRALRGLYGSPEAVLARARRAVGPPARLAGGPSRLCAYAMALRSHPSRPAPVTRGRAARRLVAELPVAIVRGRLRGRRRPSPTAEATFVDALERLGIRTLGELAALPSEAIADRFGELGVEALQVARGAEEPLRPRHPAEQLAEHLELPESASGTQLARALDLIIDRLLSSGARRGRSFRRLRLEAQLAGGGGWRAEVALRDPSAERERLRLVLAGKLARLPRPARELGLRVLETGPVAAGQPQFMSPPEDERRDRLTEAIRQTRAVAGRDALLRVVEVDPGSRVPERRALLTPFPEPESGR